MAGMKVYLTLMIAAVASVSGCTGGISPAEKAQAQADQAQAELMQKVNSQGVSFQVMAAYERDGDTVLTMVNTGNKVFSTANLTVKVEGEDFSCNLDKNVSPAAKFNCRTSSEFPSFNNSQVYVVTYMDIEKANYTCRVKSRGGVAC
ncbi:MAG: hypothetical protein ABEK10_01975 [Candidatus Nanosalina sp.]